MLNYICINFFIIKKRLNVRNVKERKINKKTLKRCYIYGQHIIADHDYNSIVQLESHRMRRCGGPAAHCYRRSGVVCVWVLVTTVSHAKRLKRSRLRWESRNPCVRWVQIGVTSRIRLSDLCSAAMRPVTISPTPTVGEWHVRKMELHNISQSSQTARGGPSHGHG